MDLHRAQQLVNDPLVQEIFEALEREYTNDWKAASTKEEREECFLAVTIVGKLKRRLSSLAADGRMQEMEQKVVL